MQMSSGEKNSKITLVLKLVSGNLNRISDQKKNLEKYLDVCPSEHMTIPSCNYLA